MWRCVRWTLAHLLRIYATPSDANHWPSSTSYANEGSGKLAMVKPWCRYDVIRRRWHGGGALLDADSYFCRRRGSSRKWRGRSRSRQARRRWKWVADARVASFFAHFNVEWRALQRRKLKRRFDAQSVRAACARKDRWILCTLDHCFSTAVTLVYQVTGLGDLLTETLNIYQVSNFFNYFSLFWRKNILLWN